MTTATLAIANVLPLAEQVMSNIHTLRNQKRQEYLEKAREVIVFAPERHLFPNWIRRAGDTYSDEYLLENYHKWPFRKAWKRGEVWNFMHGHALSVAKGIIDLYDANAEFVEVSGSDIGSLFSLVHLTREQGAAS